MSHSLSLEWLKLFMVQNFHLSHDLVILFWIKLYLTTELTFQFSPMAFYFLGGYYYIFEVGVSLGQTYTNIHYWSPAIYSGKNLGNDDKAVIKTYKISSPHWDYILTFLSPCNSSIILTLPKYVLNRQVLWIHLHYRYLINQTSRVKTNHNWCTGQPRTHNGVVANK